MKNHVVLGLLHLLFYCHATTAHFARDVHNYLWANYNQFSGNDYKAQERYHELLNQKSSPYFYKGYIPLLSELLDHHKEIVDLIPSIDEHFKDDPEIQQLFAQALQKTGNQKESDERYIKLSNKFKNDQTIAFQTANIYIRRKEPENALITIDNLLNNSPKKSNNFIFYFLKSQIYVQLDDPQKALENTKLCLSLHPYFDKGWLLLSLLEEQAGRLNEAIKGYTTFLELSTTKNQDIEQHLLQLIFKQKMALNNGATILVPQSSFTQALQLFERKDYSAALDTINTALQTQPTDPENRLLKIQIMTAMNNLSPAADLVKTWILEDPTHNVWYEVLYLLYRAGLPLQKTIALLHDINHAKPDAILPSLYLADLHTRAHNPDTALLYHKQAIALTKDPRLKTKILYHMGLLYREQQQYEAMEKVLEEGYSLNLDFPPLLNLLAYHYAEQDKNLILAEQLVKRALQSNRDNPHFLDTQAFILYKQGNYDTALRILTKITQQEPNDTAILSTLGKTYYKMGQTSKAIDTLEHALQITKNDKDKEQYANLLKQWKKS